MPRGHWRLRQQGDIMCLWLVRPAQVKACLQRDFLLYYRISPLKKLLRQPGFTALPVSYIRVSRLYHHGHSGIHIILSPMQALQAAEAHRGPGRLVLHITVSYFLMRCLNSEEMSLRSSDSTWRTG